jgi:peroxiredoxin
MYDKKIIYQDDEIALVEIGTSIWLLDTDELKTNKRFNSKTALRIVLLLDEERYDNILQVIEV